MRQTSEYYAQQHLGQAHLTEVGRPHGRRISLEELFGMLAFFVDEATGSVSLVHVSGSYVRFEADGRLHTHAAASLVSSAEKYVYMGKGEAPDDVETDAANLARIAAGDPQAIRELIIEQRQPHLYEEAKRVASEHGHLD